MITNSYPLNSVHGLYVVDVKRMKNSKQWEEASNTNHVQNKQPRSRLGDLMGMAKKRKVRRMSLTMKT
jgi:hypothetical protein